MQTSQKATSLPFRLNPFMFPADTDFRFALLITLVIGTSMFIYTLLYNALPANWNHLQVLRTHCNSVATHAYPTSSTSDIVARNAAIYQCTAPFYREQA